MSGQRVPATPSPNTELATRGSGSRRPPRGSAEARCHTRPPASAPRPSAYARLRRGGAALQGERRRGRGSAHTTRHTYQRYAHAPTPTTASQTTGPANGKARPRSTFAHSHSHHTAHIPRTLRAHTGTHTLTHHDHKTSHKDSHIAHTRTRTQNLSTVLAVHAHTCAWHALVPSRFVVRPILPTDCTRHTQPGRRSPDYVDRSRGTRHARLVTSLSTCCAR